MFFKNVDLIKHVFQQVFLQKLHSTAFKKQKMDLLISWKKMKFEQQQFEILNVAPAIAMHCIFSHKDFWPEICLKKHTYLLLK